MFIFFNIYWFLFGFNTQTSSLPVSQSVRGWFKLGRRILLFIFCMQPFYWMLYDFKVFFSHSNPKKFFFSSLADSFLFENPRCRDHTQRSILSQSKQRLKLFETGRLVSHDPETHLPLRPPPAVIRPASSSVSRQLRSCKAMQTDFSEWCPSNSPKTQPTLLPRHSPPPLLLTPAVYTHTSSKNTQKNFKWLKFWLRCTLHHARCLLAHFKK